MDANKSVDVVCNSLQRNFDYNEAWTKRWLDVSEMRLFNMNQIKLSDVTFSSNLSLTVYIMPLAQQSYKLFDVLGSAQWILLKFLF